MATLRELERRLMRVERCIAATTPSRWTDPCALPPLSIPQLREVLKTLIVTAPTQAAGDDAADEQVNGRTADATR